MFRNFENRTDGSIFSALYFTHPKVAKLSKNIFGIFIYYSFIRIINLISINNDNLRNIVIVSVKY